MHAFFVRHGQTTYNVLGLCNDDPTQSVVLTEKGKFQAEEVARMLAGKPIECVVVSELPRTMETAAIINKYHNVPILIDSRINDRKTGFEGQPARSFRQAIEHDKISGKINNGESFLEEKERILSFLADLKKCAYNNVLVVSHDEPLRIIKGHFNKYDNNTILSSDIDYCEIIDVQITTNATISEENT